MSGMLYVCATPIGNLEDITLRVLRILKEVDFIAAEDTRHTQKLLNHYDITTPSTSYFEHNKAAKGPDIIRRMLAGESCALVSDAGMPGISDPGEDLIRLCYENDITVTVCPGATAVVSALVLSGLATGRYCFEAFLTKDKKERALILEQLKKEVRTIVFYEAPHRLIETFEVLLKELGDRDAAVVREITKKFETVQKGKLSDLIRHYKENPPKGEIVLIIQGLDFKDIMKSNQEKWDDIELQDHMKIYLDQGMSEKDAMKKVSRDRGVGKREIYSILKR